jgi:hypothetical protein
MALSPDELVDAPAPQIAEIISASEWRDYDGMVAQLRSWVEARGISYALLDELANLAAGTTGHVLGEAQTKRLGMMSLLAMMSTLGLRCRFEEDPALVEQMRPHWEQCEVGKQRTHREARIGKTAMKRVFPAVLRELSKRGNAARNIALSAARRRAIARKAGKASGRARLRKGLFETREARL